MIIPMCELLAEYCHICKCSECEIVFEKYDKPVCMQCVITRTRSKKEVRK